MLVVGLGNPGSSYEFTRHNAGFLTLDLIAEELGISVKTIKFKGLYGEGRYAGQKVRLLKPQTFMNLSGESVRQAAEYFHIAPEEILVLVDDIDIGFGEIRLKAKGSAGTHNGLKSIIYQLQSENFPRLKIGVGKKHPSQDLADFVLSRFSKEEGKVMEKTFERGAEAAMDVLEHGIEHAMNAYNGK